MEETVKMHENKVQELVQAKLEQAEERRLELIEKQREKLKERVRPRVPGDPIEEGLIGMVAVL